MKTCGKLGLQGIVNFIASNDNDDLSVVGIENLTDSTIDRIPVVGEFNKDQSGNIATFKFETNENGEGRKHAYLSVGDEEYKVLADEESMKNLRDKNYEFLISYNITMIG